MSAKRRALLRRGDTVGVVSPGFAVEAKPYRSGIARLRRMGYRVVEGRHVLASDGYLAGSDDERLADLVEMLRRPEVRAIWFARGGYGTARLLDRLPRGLLARSSKPMIGYSDLTALFAASLRVCDAPCLYGPVVTELGEPAHYHAPPLRAALAGEPTSLRLRRSDVLAEGRARGRLIGGNLTVLTHLCGTRFLPESRGAVLFLEETGEPAYRIDRMLTQLRQAGVLRGLAAVLLGRFSVPSRRKFPPDRPLETILREFLDPPRIPVVTGLPAGHLDGKQTLRLGGSAEIDTDARLLRFKP